MSMATINELREQRAGIVSRMRELVDAAERENRAMTAEEEENYAQANADCDTLHQRITRMEQLSRLETGMDEGADPDRIRALRGGERIDAGDHEQRRAFARYIFNGAVDPNFLRADERPQSGELRAALGVSMAGTGGYLAPVSFERKLIDYIGNQNVIRSLADVRSSAANVDVPYVTTHTTAYHIAEGASFTASTPAFNAKTLKAYKTGALTYLTHEALEDIVINIERWLVDDFGQAFADLEETDFISGTGTAEPTGILTGGKLALTAASTTAITGDELLALQHAVKAAYRRKAVWVMNDATALTIRKLKTTDGQYLWQPSLREGAPDMLLGNAVHYSDAMPKAAAGNKAVVFGDLKRFRIQDRSGLYLQRLNEAAATSGQVGFLAYRRYDSAVMIPEAIQYLQMHA